MTVQLQIDPVTRIEGHMAVKITVDSNRVIEAHSKGEMFRGFELILKGRDPLDAQQITQRICGVCPVSHGTASIMAQDAAYGVVPTKNGRLLRNLILGANYIQSHIIHFYQLSALDFVDITAICKYGGNDPFLKDLKAWVESGQQANVLYPAAPFLPRYDGDYIQDDELNISAIHHYLKSLEMRALAHQMGALFSGKLPHAASLVPGGVTEEVNVHKIAACQSMITKLRQFIDSAYLPDVLAVASAYPEYFEIGKGSGNLLAYGVFPEDDSTTFFPDGVWMNDLLHGFDREKITEDTSHAFYRTDKPLSPDTGETQPVPDKDGAYSWIKAPRYDGRVVEVGPLARMWVAYQKQPDSDIGKWVDRLLVQLDRDPADLFSTMGRHAMRALECKLVAHRCEQWLSQLMPGKSACNDFQIPETGVGVGLTEAPRGALGHWLEIRDHKIHRYQCVVPTTWNCSPRDENGQPGPVEQALVNTPIGDENNPIEAVRVVRSFDPCLACAVH